MVATRSSSAKPKKAKAPSIVPRVDCPVTEYATLVTKGKIVAGPHVRAACERHLSDLKFGHTRGLTFDYDAANRIYRYFETILKLSEGQFEGIPFILDLSQKFIVGSIFGWKRADGSRRFRRAYVEMGKGNGKSPLVGGIGLYGLTSDDEPGAQIYAAGAKKEQAKILFDDAVKMVQKSPELSSRVHQTGGTNIWNLAYLSNGSFFRPISRDAGKSGSGPRPHFALCDEVHEHPNRHVMELLERGFKFRRQPLLLMITNSGSDRNSVCWEEHTHAIKVASGEVQDDTTFSYVCALDDDDDPLEDETCWIKANPMLGKILTYDYLRDIVKQAKDIPGKLNGILRLHFCQWTDADRAWIARSAYEACEDPKLRLEQYYGKKCWIGLDLAVTTDLAAKSYVFEDGFDEREQPKYVLFSRAYTPADTMRARAVRDGLNYELWAKDGFLAPLPGKTIGFDFIAADIMKDQQDFDLQFVAYDQWMIKAFAEELEKCGAEIPVVEHPQGFTQRKDSPLWMPQSIDFTEKLVLERRLRIEVNPLLRSCFASVALLPSPAGLRRFDKQKATSRIDCAVSSAMAIGAAHVAAPTKQKEYNIFFLGA